MKRIRTNYGRVFIENLAAGLLAALCLLLQFAFGGTVSAQTYSCGDPSTAHCYGLTSWREQTEYFGAYTDISQNRLNCPGGCGGFIDNEMWLIDSNSEECRANRYQACWVEAGYIAVEGQNRPVFFWADVRPGNQSNLDVRLLGPSDASDPAGVTDHFMIIKDGRVSPSTFQVFIYSDTLSILYNGVSVVPTGNPMKANRIDIGSELAGTGGASAEPVNFTRNIWAVQALGAEYVFWYLPQTTRGSVFSSNPPFASWTIDPASPPPPEGGQFTTRCCS